MEHTSPQGPSRNPHMTVALVGLVDAGKSTLLGSLLYEAGRFNDKDFKKTKELAENHGKLSFVHSFLVTKIREERDRGVTVGPRYFFRTIGSVDYTFVDTPGHRDYFKSALGGITQADVTIFVCPPKYVFELLSGYQSEAFNKFLQVIFFRRPLKVIFAINALDDLHPHGLKEPATEYESIFNRCKEYIEKRLRLLVGSELGTDLAFVPVSPRTSHTNLMRPKDLEMPVFEWHPHSLQAELETVSGQLQVRNFDLPLKVVCCYDCKVSGVGWVFVGSVEAGVLSVGTKFRIAGHSQTLFVVKNIHYMDRPVMRALPGEMVGINFTEHKLDYRYRHRFVKVRGMVFEDLTEPETGVVKGFDVRLKILTANGTFQKGWRPLAYAHRDKFGIKLVAFKELNPTEKEVGKSGSEGKDDAKAVPRMEKGKLYLARFKIERTEREVILHDYATFGSCFGKVYVEEARKIVGLGIVLKTYTDLAFVDSEM